MPRKITPPPNLRAGYLFLRAIPHHRRLEQQLLTLLNGKRKTIFG
jgi:hypothetical protein